MHLNIVLPDHELVKFHFPLSPTQPLSWSQRLHLPTAPASAYTTPTHAPPHVPLTQCRFTTSRSDQTPVPESAALLWGAGAQFTGAGRGAAHAAGCNPKSALYKPVCTSNNLGAMRHARLAAFWTVAGVLGTLAVFPYALAINPTLVAQLPMPLRAPCLCSRPLWRAALHSYGRRSPPACPRRCS